LRRRDWKNSVKRGRELAVFAVEEIAHCLAPGFVGFLGGLAFFGAHAALSGGAGRIGGGGFLCALGAAVGEAGFVGFEFELFFADGADFDGKRHFDSDDDFKSWLA